jgi:hypothetical protein
MVKNSFWLALCLLITWSNANAWYCTYEPDSNGYMVEDSLQCYDIDPSIAIMDYWCVSYQPSDPICQNYSTCVDQTEQRTTACTEPFTTGFVNESRFYSCDSDSWTDWTVSSSHCEPLPPTCVETVEERTVACQDGYTGLISEQRLTTCSTPYSDPIVGPWIMVSEECTLKATDPTSIESPLNPASPLSLDQPDPVGITSGTVDMMTPQMDLNPMEQEQVLPQEKTNQQEQKSTTQPSTSNSLETKEEKKQEAKQEKTIKTKENETVVPGFGIAIDFALIEQPQGYYQQELTNILDLEQEQDYAREQDFLLNLIESDDYSSSFDSSAYIRWRSLLDDNPLQQDAFGD